MPGRRPPTEIETPSATDGLPAREEPTPSLFGDDEPAAGPPAEGRLAQTGRSAGRWVLDNRYFVLSGALVLLVLVYTLKNRWAAGIDIWEHAAAARELGDNPFDPGHPLFAVDRPHQLLSPYHLVLGLISRVTGLSIMTVFDLAGIANVMLLLVGLRLFTTRLLGRRHVDFYSLLFILFLWGPTPWFFSGFLHFNVFPLVLPYPSTFAKGLVLLGLAVHLRFLDQGDRRALAATVAIGAVLLLAHPVDALFFFVGLAALAMTRRPDERRRNVTFAALAVAASAVLALAWPYYSLWDLVFGAGNETYRHGLASADHDMYVNVLPRLWPALIAVPFVLRRFLREWNDTLLWMLGGLLVLYTYGWLSEEWTYGRLLSAIMVVVAIILADETARAVEEAAAMGSAGRGAARWIQFATLGLVALGMFQVRHGFVMLPDFVLSRLPYSAVHSFVDLAPISEYSFLSDFVDDGQVVIADGYRSMEVPAFGGKVMALGAPEAFVDTTERSADSVRFFDMTTPDAVRRQIIDKYDASFLLIPQERLSADPATYQRMTELGPVVHRNDRFILIDLRKGG